MRRIRTIDIQNRSAIRETPENFWTLFGSILSKIFGEIAEDNTLLENCYCPVRSRDFDEQFILSITTGIPGALLCPGGFNPSQFLNEKLLSIRKDPHPYLIIGDVGSGKTTYINYFFKIKAKQLGIQDKLEGLLIDLRYIGSENSNILEYIENQIHEKLTNEYPEISNPDLAFGMELFEKELACSENLFLEIERIANKEVADKDRLDEIKKHINNRREFNAARIRYIEKNLNKKVYLIFDNVDHYSVDFQNRTFGVGARLRIEYDCSIIMTTRSYTVPTALTHSWVSAYQPRFLNLSGPKAKELLNKRIEYTLNSKIIRSIFSSVDKNVIQIETVSGKKISFDIDALESLLKSALDSLINDELFEFIERMSGGDFRFMLKMIKVALSSGYIYPEERQDKYLGIRYYDFIRAIMLGNNLYYDGDNPSTLVLNLFDNDDKLYTLNNLIRYRTLQAIDRFSKKVFVPELLAMMETIGYDPVRVKSVLDLFLESSLVEAPHYEGTKINDHIRVLQLTYKGREYLENLCSEITYLECIKHSCYMDEEYHEMMMQLMNRKERSKDKRIQNRLDATDIFIEYLLEQEKEEEINVNSLGEKAKQVYSDFPKIAQTIQPPFNQIRNIILRRQ